MAKRKENTEEVTVHWNRTGRTIQELSENKGGIITLAEEVNNKGKKRLVAIEYITVKKPENKRKS